MQVILKNKKEIIDILKEYNYHLSKYIKKSQDNYILQVDVGTSLKINLYKIKSFNDIIKLHSRTILSYDLISKLMKKLKLLDKKLKL